MQQITNAQSPKSSAVSGRQTGPNVPTVVQKIKMFDRRDSRLSLHLCRHPDSAPNQLHCSTRGQITLAGETRRKRKRGRERERERERDRGTRCANLLPGGADGRL